MEGDTRRGQQPNLYSVRGLLTAKIPGRIKIRDVIFSAKSFRVYCFEARVRTAIIFRTRLLDASSARLEGDSFMIRDIPLPEPPNDAFEFSNLGWVFGTHEAKIGDVADILIDEKLRIMEFTVKLGHRLLLPDDMLELLPKRVQKDYMRNIPDVASVMGDAYTLAPLPVQRVKLIKNNPLYYEVLTDIDVNRLTNHIFTSLSEGVSRKGIVRTLFEEVVQRQA